MRTLVFMGGGSAAAVACWLYLLLHRVGVSRRSSDRLFVETGGAPEPAAAEAAIAGGPLRRWLFLAGFRDSAAPAVFTATVLMAIAAGLAVEYLIRRVGLTDDLIRNLARLPAGVSDLFLPVAYLAPWIVFLMLASLPWLVVRRARRQRVEQVEQDLPISLELLATLSEAGLGFDAALSHLLDAVEPDRPLTREFVTYQSNVLAGRTRIESLRRFARRLEVPSTTIFVSAMVQAEQLGTGIAQTLCRQAEDLRNRRRERANAFAMALPVKRMFPLVICFMPGIFVWTLGPFFLQLFQFADTFMQMRNF